MIAKPLTPKMPITSHIHEELRRNEIEFETENNTDKDAGNLYN